MNEIIERLNEIEKKANAILREAKGKKEQISAEFEADKRAVDAKYDRLEKEATQQLSRRLEADADARLERVREESRSALEMLEFLFVERGEMLVREIVDRVTQ